VLITVEGLDGAGKTTLVAGLAAALDDVVVLREPGGVQVSERIRALVQDPALEVDARAEALLYAAARAQLVAERVRPLLAAGRTVLLDRFVDSSLAYQGAGRGLGVEEVRALNAFATGGLRPDRTLLLRVDPAAGLARIAGRPADRLEREDGGFWAAVAAGYDALAAAEPDRIAVIDAHASAIISSSPFRGSQPSSARMRSEAATSAAGSPARRPSSRAGMGSPVTFRAVSITSRTV
jgi:dTMP kinase